MSKGMTLIAATLCGFALTAPALAQTNATPTAGTMAEPSSSATMNGSAGVTTNTTGGRIMTPTTPATSGAARNGPNSPSTEGGNASAGGGVSPAQQ